MPNLDITEEWIVAVLDDSMEMDWTTADGARAIMRALEVSFGYRPPSGDQGPIAVGQATQCCQIGHAEIGEVVECPPVHGEAERVVADHQFKPHACGCGQRFCTGSELTWHRVQHHDLPPVQP